MKEGVGLGVQLDLDLDTSFVKEMIEGGFSDDGSSLIGDISYNDENDYSKIELTKEEEEEALKEAGLI